jgi:hypothetical protein
MYVLCNMVVCLLYVYTSWANLTAEHISHEECAIMEIECHSDKINVLRSSSKVPDTFAQM